jgi:hypothetical protein
MKAQAVVGLDRGSTSIKRLLATIDGPEGVSSGDWMSA